MIASFFTWIQFYELASRLCCFMGRKSIVATTEEPRDRIQVLQNKKKTCEFYRGINWLCTEFKSVQSILNGPQIRSEDVVR